MHEMAISCNIVEIVSEAAIGRQVWRGMRITSWSNPLRRRMVMALGARLAATLIELAAIPSRMLALAIKDRPAVCPNCGGYQLQMTGGNELRIKELEVA